jgi:hypothetical protein
MSDTNILTNNIEDNETPGENKLVSTGNSIKHIINQTVENNPGAAIILDNAKEIVQNVADLATNLTKNEKVHEVVNNIKNFTSQMANNTKPENSDPDLNEFRKRKGKIEIVETDQKQKLNDPVPQNLTQTDKQKIIAKKLLIVLHELCKKTVYPDLKKNISEFFRLLFLHLFFHYITTKILRY